MKASVTWIRVGVTRGLGSRGAGSGLGLGGSGLGAGPGSGLGGSGVSPDLRREGVGHVELRKLERRALQRDMRWEETWEDEVRGERGEKDNGALI